MRQPRMLCSAWPESCPACLSSPNEPKKGAMGAGESSEKSPIDTQNESLVLLLWMLNWYLTAKGLYRCPPYACAGYHGRVNKLVPPERHIAVKNQAKVNSVGLVLKATIAGPNGTGKLDRVGTLAKHEPFMWCRDWHRLQAGPRVSKLLQLNIILCPFKGSSNRSCCCLKVSDSC